jgi:hypothetical protein
MSSTHPVAAGSRFATVILLVFFAFVAFSATHAQSSTRGQQPSAAAQQREAEAQKFVDEKLEVWKERMNLQGWNIRARLVRPSALEPKTLGGIQWDTDKKTASISVLSSYNYTLPYQEMLDDMEFTIVHELVHLELASLPRSEASRRIEEHAVNELARALLNLANK